MTTNYNFRTGELSGQKVCQYCEVLETIVPEFAPADYHQSAKCVEPDEPYYVR